PVCLPHSTLPPFPTRRSSDLINRCLKRPLVCCTNRVDHVGFNTFFIFGLNILTEFRDVTNLGTNKTLHCSLLGTVLDQMFLAFADRKSTRLNSSHVSISYAVF